MEIIDKQFMIKVVGDPGVGKKSIMSKYANKPHSTVQSKIIEYKGKKVELNIWEVSTQSMQKTNILLKDCDGLFFVYDITKYNSFANLKENNIFLELKKNKIPAIILGNKSDLFEQEGVSPEEAQKFAKENGIEFKETSIENVSTIEKAFEMLIGKMYAKNIGTQNIQNAETSKFKNPSSRKIQGTKGKTKGRSQSSDKKDKEKIENKTGDNINKSYKIILYGKAGVGKETIIKNYSSNNAHSYIFGSTIVDYENKKIELDLFKSSDVKEIKVVFEGAKGCFLLYDITKKDSFAFLKKNYQNIKNILKDNNKNIPFIIIGNKKDLFLDRKVEEKEVKQFANELQCKNFEISCLNNNGMNDPFIAMIEKIHELNDDGGKSDNYNGAYCLLY